MPDTTSSPLAANVRRVTSAHRLDDYINQIADIAAPSPHVNIHCIDRLHSHAVAAVLAGSGATAERCDDNGLGSRRFTIVVVGAPVHITWSETYQPASLTRGALSERRHTGPGAATTTTATP